MDAAFRRAVAEARRQGDLYFAGLLPEDRIIEAFGKARWLWQGWIYSPAVTIWVFLSQCLSADHSCRDAVARLIGWRVAQGQPPCSAETGAYCTARDELPEEACSRLVRETGQPGRRGMRRRVALVRTSRARCGRLDDRHARHAGESSGVSATGGTKHAAAAFPSRESWWCFRWRWARCWTRRSASIRESRRARTACSAPCTACCGKATWCWRTAISAAGSTLPCCSNVASHSVVRKHQMRATDFRTGQRLGKDDHLVGWTKPQRPDLDECRSNMRRCPRR